MSSALPDGLLRIATAPLALPTGMRDLLPPRSVHRRANARAILGHFESFGYQQVVPPAFEREEVVTRGLSSNTRRDLVRFLDPETGDVLVLRPDMTPQIARIAATRYRDTPGPLRFMYEGSVVRRPRGRARRHRQISQAGIECIDWRGPEADVEVIRAAAGALAAAGVPDARIELGHAAMGEILLRGVPFTLRDAVTDALSTRDGATLARLLGTDFAAGSMMSRATALAGGPDVLERARRVLVEPVFEPVLTDLEAVVQGLARAGLADRVLFDFAEIRGLGYYTGTTFQLLAEGPGEPLGAGGRYDSLLERYGAARPATGCALDLELIEWAVALRGNAYGSSPRRVVLGGDPGVRGAHADRLRSQGVSVAESPLTEPRGVLGFAMAGGYDAALVCVGDSLREIDPHTGALRDTNY
jgi:ATP phosphoribosyltransferase regulatory subunit